MIEENYQIGQFNQMEINKKQFNIDATYYNDDDYNLKINYEAVPKEIKAQAEKFQKEMNQVESIPSA